MIYHLNQTPNGYELTSGKEKYLMLLSKRPNTPTPYYLRQIEPQSNYISGLFYNKKKQEYKGKDINNNRIIVRLGISTAELLILY